MDTMKKSFYIAFGNLDHTSYGHTLKTKTQFFTQLEKLD